MANERFCAAGSRLALNMPQQNALVLLIVRRYFAHMRFLKPTECDGWMAKAPPCPSTRTLSLHLPPESGRVLFIARSVADAIIFRQPCLLRVTESDIWDSSNNWHLYYHLRQSYGDHLLLDEAPGHLFLGHEAEDLTTFLHVAMLFGWDAELQPLAPYLSARLSHDGFLDLYSEDSDPLPDFRKLMEQQKLIVQTRL